MLTLGKGRHELACASCGAPLRQMKMLPQPVQKPAAVTHQPVVRQFAKPTKVVEKKYKKPMKVKKRKKWFKDWAEDVFDLVEDIFD
ncbi:MAG: hypothetical protein ACSHWS_15900 [Sulfitobacter sp.]